MKNNYSLLVLLLGFILLLGSCQATKSYTINVTNPAPVFLDSSLTKIGVINRTETKEENKPLEVLDKVLTAEGKNLDKDAANAATQSIARELQKNLRFDKVIIIDSSGLKTPGLGIFPASIPWSELELIANKHDVDVVFVLSFLDSDTKIDYSNSKKEIKNTLGVKLNILEHQAKVQTNIKIGWRIYDVRNRIIKDELIINDVTTSTGSGINPLKALEAIINKRENVLEISNYLGQAYAHRVTPYNFEASRAIYVRGSQNLKTAKRYVNAGKWDDATEIWLNESKNTKNKVAGRATYNLAMITESNGNLEEAIEWANTSYLKYNNKKALTYLNVLKDRLDKQNELENQLKN